MDGFKKSVFTGPRYSRGMEEFCNGRQVFCVITDRYGNKMTTDIVTIHLKNSVRKTKEVPRFTRYLFLFTAFE